MENVIFVKNRIFKKVSNTCFFKFSITNCFISNITVLINTLKWELWSIWKARNKVKYDKIHINQALLYNIWKQTLKSELNILLIANCNDTIDKTKILTILSLISS